MFWATFSVAQAQHFETDRLMNQREVPTEAFLYKHPSGVVKQAAQNIFEKYDVWSFFEGDREYFVVPGNSFEPILMGGINITYWIEELGDQKSVLYLTALTGRTRVYAAVLKHAAIQSRIIYYLGAIEMESVEVSKYLFLSEQHSKVDKLTNELYILQSDLQNLEEHSPQSTTQIFQLRSAVRSKRAELNQEIDILNRIKSVVDMVE